MNSSRIAVAAAALASISGGFGIGSPNISRKKYRGDYCVECKCPLPPGRFGRKCPKCRGEEPTGEHLNVQST